MINSVVVVVVRYIDSSSRGAQKRKVEVLRPAPSSACQSAGLSMVWNVLGLYLGRHLTSFFPSPSLSPVNSFFKVPA